MSFLLQKGAGKLLLLIVSIIVGVVATVLRFAFRATHKLSQNSLVNKIKKDPKLTAEVAEGLDFPYGRIKIPKEVFEQLRRKMISMTTLGPYGILYAASYGTNGLLILTEMEFTDFQMTVTGKHNDVAEKAFHNFSLQYNQASSEVVVRSSEFYNATDKFQKEDFVKNLRAFADLVE